MRLRFIRSLFLVLAISLAAAAAAVAAFRPGPALAGGLLTDPNVTYTFGSQITFSARLAPGVQVKEALVSFRPQGVPDTVVGSATLAPDGGLSFVYDLSTYRLRAFSTVDYWFTLTLQSSEVVVGDALSFQYIDNRFNWQTLDDDPFRVHWYEGDIAFAQSIIDAARAGLERANNIIPLPNPSQVDIYAYTNQSDYKSTLQLSGQDWMAGNAVVDQHLMAVTLLPGPEQHMEMGRQIPHELMHILLYQALGNGYQNLPLWLSEGLATMAEENPNPDYRAVLESAIKQSRVLPVTSLCGPFPLDSSNAMLAYAEADSLTRYIYRQYGSTRLQELVGQYADGVECERGAELALGKSLSEIEKDWLGGTGPLPVPTNQVQVTATPLDLAPGSQALSWSVLLVAVLVAPLGLAVLMGPAAKRKSQPADKLAR